jgi:hypothetical protein
MTEEMSYERTAINKKCFRFSSCYHLPWALAPNCPRNFLRRSLSAG